MTHTPTRNPARRELPHIENPNPKVHGIGSPHIARRMLEMARLVAEKIDRNLELLKWMNTGCRQPRPSGRI